MDVAQAAERLAGIANQTPVLTSRTLDGLTGRNIFLKCENFQRVGAFKFRGAYNAISQLTDRQKEAGVITHSSGNHAQGIALAAALLGVKSVVVMPEDAPAIKREATLDYGATIITCQAIDRERVTAEQIADHHYILIHPYDNDHIIAGQGTAAWELFDEVELLDYLFVPVGGGGLISGCALAVAGRYPGCQVIGVEPEIASDATRSWQTGHVITLPEVPKTIADGLRTRAIGERNLAIMRRYVHGMVTVSEEQIIQTLYFLWQRLKIVVEPSSAVALAPIFTQAFDKVGQRVGVILSGGNVDFANFKWPSSVIAPEGSANSTHKLYPAQTLADLAKPRVLVCDAVDEELYRPLLAIADVEFEPSIDAERLQAIIGQYHGLITGTRTPITDQVIEYGYKLKVIGTTAENLDHIDVSTARALGIELVYNPGAETLRLAEQTISSIWRLERQLTELDSAAPEDTLTGKRLGIIGFGRTGREVSRKAQAFDMKVVVNQPRLTPELALADGVHLADLEDLLRDVDVLTLHVPVSPETEGIISHDQLRRMKKGALVINLASQTAVDLAALKEAITSGWIGGAVLGIPDAADDELVSEWISDFQEYPRVILTTIPHLKGDRHSALFENRFFESFINSLIRVRPNESLSLDILPVDQVHPHEQIDEKRVRRLITALSESDMLVNPPLVKAWHGAYIVLDGATRYTALKRLGYPYLIAQVIGQSDTNYTLHTWYHVISSSLPFTDLLEALQKIEHLQIASLPVSLIPNIFTRDPSAICYLLDRDGHAWLVTTVSDQRLDIMNQMVDAYTNWGMVERSLSADLDRLIAQFPQLVAVMVFPQFEPDMVFELADKGQILPAGLTRFMVPGRILRLNADLERLRRLESRSAKRAWLNDLLRERLSRSRLRYYQEPVVLLDD